MNNTPPAGTMPPTHTGFSTWVHVPGSHLDYQAVFDTQVPDAQTIAQADISYDFNYGAVGVENLRLGANFGGFDSRSLAMQQARAASKGEDGAVAVVAARDGGFQLFEVLQPQKLIAHERTTGWVPFRPADGLQEWDGSIGQRVPRRTLAVSFGRPDVLAIFDDNIVLRSPLAAKQTVR